MSVWLSGSTFNVKNTATRRRKLQSFLDKFNLSNSFNSATTYFDYIIDNFGPIGSFRSGGETEEENRLKTENENLKKENERLGTLFESQCELTISAVNEKNKLKEENAQFLKLRGDAGRWQHEVEEENKQLKQENEQLKSAIQNPQSEIITELVADPHALSLLPQKLQDEITDLTNQKKLLQMEINTFLMHDVRLTWLTGYKKEENDSMADCILNFKEAYDNTITGIMHNPLRLLEEEEYKALLKWDAEVFLPAMEQMLTPELKQQYGIVDIKAEMTSKHKFYLFWDFVLYDPAEKLEALLPALTAEQKSALQEMRFPRWPAVENVLKDIQHTKTEAAHATAQLAETEKEKPAADTEEGRVVALNPAAKEPAPGADAEGRNGPEQ